jgi:hypothetical protein
MVLVGCGGQTPVSGSWRAVNAGASGVTSQVDLQLRTDGTYVLVLGVGDQHSETDGTYTYDSKAKKLTMTGTKMATGGREVDLTDPKYAAPPQVADVTWKSPNEMELKTAGGQLDLKRQ